MIRIIANKKVEMENDEYMMYENVCKSYDDAAANRKGADLFINHFESNNDGIILFVKPPPGRYTTLEVFCFLCSIMMNQHLRNMQAVQQSMINEATVKINDLIKEVKDLKAEVSEFMKPKE